MGLGVAGSGLGGVVSCFAVGYFYVWVSEQLCDEGSLFACVPECGPGLCCGFSLWVWRDFRGGFLGEVWEGVVVWDVVDDIFFLLVFGRM